MAGEKQMKRFITEYAGYKKAKLIECMTSENKKTIYDHIATIDKYVSACKCGLVTIDECIYKISSIGN